VRAAPERGQPPPAAVAGSAREIVVHDRCPICQELGDHRVHLAREMMFGTREPFEYRECLACGTLRITSVPADLGRHYPAAYYGPPAGAPGVPALPGEAPRDQRSFGPSVAWKWINRRRIRTALRTDQSRWPALARRLDRWGGIPREGRALLPALRLAGVRELGDPILEAGTGRRADRLVALRRMGFRDLLGVEPFIDADFVDRGVAVRRGTLEDLPERGRWALVMLHHVFEHVPDPRATLAAAHRLLRPGGTCLIRTPLADGELWARYGIDWYELDPPRHLFVFTRRSLAGLAAETGFSVVAEVDDSTELELIASEQYRRDIPLYDPRSWLVDRAAAGVAPETITAMRADVRRMNAARTAGRGALFLRRG
jgi:SAM-dependent methyltransferase